MVHSCSSAEITAPKSFGACVPFSSPVVLSSSSFRRVCRAVSLSVEGLLLLVPYIIPKGQRLRVSLPLQGGQTLDVTAVVAHESLYMGRRALDVRFVNLDKRERISIEGLVGRAIPLERPHVTQARRRTPNPKRSTTIAARDEFDGLPSTDELDSMLAATMAELRGEGSARKKKRKGRFRW